MRKHTQLTNERGQGQFLGSVQTIYFQQLSD